MTPDSPRRVAEPTPATGGEHIRPEWVEAVASALDLHRLPEGDGDLSVLTPLGLTAVLKEARVVLTAVVPAIQAQALRDAAEALMPRDYPELVDLIQRNRGAASVFAYAAAKLAQRASRIERGELP